MIPFGATVSYRPFFSEDESQLHQFGKKMLLGILVGGVLRAGRGWSGDVHADCEDMEACQVPKFYVKKSTPREV